MQGRGDPELAVGDVLPCVTFIIPAIFKGFIRPIKQTQSSDKEG